MRRGNNGMFQQSTTLYDQARSNFKNLILTKKGERLGRPDLGCDIWKMLFEPLTADTLERARLSVVEAVDRWLPYLEVKEFVVTSSDNQYAINIRCVYRFRNNPNVTDVIDIFADTSSGELSIA